MTFLFFASIFFVLLKSSKSIANKIAIYAAWIELRDTHTDHIELKKSVKRIIWSKLLKFLCVLFFFCRQSWVTDPVLFFFFVFEKKYLNSVRLIENPWIWNSTTFEIRITAYFCFQRFIQFFGDRIFRSKFSFTSFRMSSITRSQKSSLWNVSRLPIYTIFAISNVRLKANFVYIARRSFWGHVPLCLVCKYFCARIHWQTHTHRRLVNFQLACIMCVHGWCIVCTSINVITRWLLEFMSN